MNHAIGYTGCVVACLWAATLTGCSGVPSGTTGDPATTASSEPAMDREAGLLAAVESTRAAALAVLAVRPAADVQAIFESGRPSPTCPGMDASFSANTVHLKYDYAGGCVPDAVAGPAVRGSLSGTYFAPTHTIDFQLDRISQSTTDVAVRGSVQGVVRSRQTGAAFTVTVDLERSDGWTVRGNVKADIPDTGGTIRIAEGTLTCLNPQASYQVVVRNARSATGENASLAPDSGRASVTRTAPAGGDQAAPMVVEFAQETP